MAEIFDVSMDDLFRKEKRAEPQASQQPFPEQKVVLAVCEECNTPIFEAENLFRYTDKNGQKSVFCKSCQLKNKQKELQGEYAAAEKELKEKDPNAKRVTFSVG